MYQLRVDTIRIVLTVAMVIASFQISSASTQCKTIVMDILMSKCKFGPRIKRGIEKFDLEKSDYKLAKFGKIDVPELSDPKSRKSPEKRQISAEIAAGERPDEINVEDVLKITDTAVRGKEDDDGKESKLEKYFERSKYFSPIPYRPSSLMAAFRSSVSDDLLGFDLSMEELEELYNEISERLPRNSKDDAWKIFRHTAAKCCQNIKLCMEDASQIPCSMTF